MNYISMRIERYVGDYFLYKIVQFQFYCYIRIIDRFDYQVREKIFFPQR